MLLVMEYMEGGPVLLREALAVGAAIPEDLARILFRDMCKVGKEFKGREGRAFRSLAPERSLSVPPSPMTRPASFATCARQPLL